MFSLQLPRRGRHGTPRRAAWGNTQVGQEAENLRGKHGQKPTCGFGEAGLGWASLKGFHALWGVGAALKVWCLALG